MKPIDIIGKWLASLTPTDILRNEITRHNAEVDRRKAEKRQRKAAKQLASGQKVAL